MPTTPATVPALPVAPDPNDRSTFNTRAYPWSAALDPWTVAVNSAASATYDNATESVSSANAASTSATTATTEADEAAASAASASASATTATTKAGEATASATAAASSATGAATSATSASNAATAAAASAASASAIVLGVSTGQPLVRPSLTLDFANSQNVDQRITFTRASTATRVGKKGLIESVASGVPRIDYDPITLACRGLLIEEQRTNLLTYSSDFDNAAWTKQAVSIAANSAASPDGLTSADTVTVDSTGSFKWLRESVSTSVDVIYTLSAYFKAGASSYPFLLCSDMSADACGISFDLTSGAVGTTTYLTGGTNVVYIGSEITHVGSGWYRCSLTVKTLDAFSYSWGGGVLDNSATSSATAGKTVYIWGAQLEAGAFPTSYIPTTTASATRAADVAVMTGVNFSSWWNASAGTLTAEFASLNAGVSNRLFVAVSDGSTNNYAGLGARAASPAYASQVRTAGGTALSLGSFGAVTTAFQKGAMTIKANDHGVTFNGAAIGLDTATGMPTCTQLSLGGTTSTNASCYVKSVRYYPVDVSDASTVALSA